MSPCKNTSKLQLVAVVPFDTISQACTMLVAIPTNKTQRHSCVASLVCPSTLFERIPACFLLQRRLKCRIAKSDSKDKHQHLELAAVSLTELRWDASARLRDLISGPSSSNAYIIFSFFSLLEYHTSLFRHLVQCFLPTESNTTIGVEQN